MGAEEPKQRQELRENDNEECGRVGVRRIVSVGVAMPQPDDNTAHNPCKAQADPMHRAERGATRQKFGSA